MYVVLSLVRSGRDIRTSNQQGKQEKRGLFGMKSSGGAVEESSIIGRDKSVGEYAEFG